MPEWSPEIAVDEVLARRLIGAQFPEHASASLEPFAEGWDNTLWLVNGAMLFRFPRRAVAVDGVRREIAVLPNLARLLPIPITRPELVGQPAPDSGYPWPFFAAPLLPGRESSEAGLDDAARAALGPTLAGFLRALHSDEVASAVRGVAELPVDPFGRADMQPRVLKTRAALGDIQRLRLWTPSSKVLDLLAMGRGLPAGGAPVVVHGDLHFRHLLISGDAQSGVSGLSGVIDWGDLCLGPRGLDLQLLWSFLPPAARPEFLSAYGPVSADELLRARVLAFGLNALLALYGRQTGNEGVKMEAVGSLRRAAEG
ncbi:MAG TPA: phosphotransferase [Actinomycetota bacterium]|nr:phosphotransferase [Actinomycetota bacterium]